MADTSFAVGDTLTVKRWSRILFEEVLKETVVYRFMGTGKDSVFQIKDELKKGEGDTITYGLRMQLIADPHVGDSTLRGEEEKLSFYDDKVLIDLVRHGVSIRNKTMTRQRVPFDVRQEAMTGLKDYFEGLLDYWFFNQLCGYTPQTNIGWTGLNSPIAPDSLHHIWADGTWMGGSVAADETITTAGTSNVNMITLTMIDQCVKMAKTLQPAIRPIKIDGKNKWVLFMHPQQAEDLRTNTNTGQWFDIVKAQLQGGKGSDSPVYNDFLGEYHSTIMIEDVRVTNGVVSSSSTTPVTTVRRPIFCGAQAGVVAFGRNEGAKGDAKSAPIYWREQMDDYEEDFGVSANLIGGMKKCQFAFDQGNVNIATFDNAVITMGVYSAS